MKTIVDYASKVKEQHALNKTLAPVETDLTDASRSYAIGEQFINDGDLFKAKTAIAQHDALVLGTNYEAADDIITQIKNKTVTTDPVPTEGSTNPVQSNGVFVENRNIYEVMGEMGAKNLIPYPHDAKTETKAGITFTENADGSITVNGTATDVARHLVTSKQFKAGEKYILSGCPSGGAHSSNGTYTLYTQTINNYDDGEGVEFTWNDSITGITIAVYTGVTVDNLTFYPMLRLASDTDTTFQPYAKTNQQLTAENEALTNQLTNEVTTRAALGAHNLFGVGNSLDEWFAATNDGKLPTSYLASETITGTVDKDTNSIVITAYNNTGYRWGCKKINLKKNTSYTFSRTSCDGTIQLFGKNNADDRAVVISGLSNGGTVNSGDYDWWYIGFYPTRSGGYFSITDLLARLETDADTTYQPYAKTNQELTAENQTLTQNKLNYKKIASISDLPASKDIYDLPAGLYFITSAVIATQGIVNAPPIPSSASYLVTEYGTLKNIFITPQENNYPCYVGRGYSSASFTWTRFMQTNPNLIDNPFFTINQRGADSYNPASISYTFDRWRIDGSMSVVKNSDGSITLSNNSGSSNRQFVQFFEKAPASGKNAVLSVDVVSYTGTPKFVFAMVDSPYTNYIYMEINKVGVNSIKANIPDISSLASGKTKVFFTLNDGDSVTLRSVKLEVSEMSTLALDEAPNYATELLKCQRYFFRLPQVNNSDVVFGYGFAQSANSARINIVTPMEMRTNPKITVSDISKYRIRENGSSKAPTNVVFASKFANLISLQFTVTDLTTNEILLLGCFTSGEYIDFSADL